ncbi:MAG TPA: hypothetical protein VF310_03515 [Vicinamibacteria bacterium]
MRYASRRAPALLVTAALLALDGCGRTPTAPAPVASPAPGPAGDGWTTLAVNGCVSRREICRVEARTTATRLELRVTTNGDVFGSVPPGAILQAWIDTDQNPVTPVPVNGSELEFTAGPDAMLCDVGPPGSNPVVMTWRLQEDVLSRMPADHRVVDLYVRSFEYVPGRGESGPLINRVPETGHLSFQVR